ncbi:MAG: hypothetical protein AB4038_07795, partial [Prochloraceae cyanobacterium]
LKVSTLDLPATQPEDKIRSVMASIVGLFIDAQVRQTVKASEQLQQLLEADNLLIASFERK